MVGMPRLLMDFLQVSLALDKTAGGGQVGGGGGRREIYSVAVLLGQKYSLPVGNGRVSKIKCECFLTLYSTNLQTLIKTFLGSLARKETYACMGCHAISR